MVDEIHAYRGVFGSHIANVLRRLRRICHFYGSDPQFICCSATIANPREHAERLVEAPFTLVDERQNGAPAGAKSFILYNPPLIDEVLGLRQSSVLAAKDAAYTFIHEELQTVVFARARQTVELLLSYLRDELSYYGKEPATIAGYRGGYLPLERRDIEDGLRSGVLRGVVATNALELGIDIGELAVAVLTGYPGSIASTWQQVGRAGAPGASLGRRARGQQQSARSIHLHPSALSLWPLAGTCPDQPRQPAPDGQASALRRLRTALSNRANRLAPMARPMSCWSCWSRKGPFTAATAGPRRTTIGWARARRRTRSRCAAAATIRSSFRCARPTAAGASSANWTWRASR